MGDIYTARREAYDNRDAASNRAEGVERVLNAARARGDHGAVERLEIEYETALAEIRRWVNLANEIEKDIDQRDEERRRAAAAEASRPKSLWERIFG